MSTSGRPANMPWLSPYLIAKNAEATLSFLERGFGFTEREVIRDEKGEIKHVEMAYHDMVIMFGAEGTYEGKVCRSPVTLGQECPLFLYTYCENVDELCERAVKAGAKLLSPPEDQFWGDRMCRLQDIDGYCWSFATHKPNATKG